MWIFSSGRTKLLFLLLLGLTGTCTSKKRGFNNDDFKAILEEISSLESEEQKNILKSLTPHIGDDATLTEKTPLSEDTVFAEESKKSILIRVKPTNVSPVAPYQDQKTNDSINYDFVQWYASPGRNTEHHVKSRKLDSSIDKPIKIVNNKHDMKAQGTTYSSTNYYHDSHEDNYDHSHGSGELNHDNHYHVDHNRPHESSGTDGDRKQFTSYRSQEEGNNYHNPSSDVFYKKMKLKKVKKNCTRSKNKKIQKWPAGSDVHSRANSGPAILHYDTKSFPSVPALPGERFNTAPKFLDIPDPPSKPSGFSGDSLSDVPRTHFFQYKDGEGVNHYHLHNHHYHVDANGQKVRKANVPDYRNLANHFDKLKTLLTTKESDNSYPVPHSADNFRSTLSIGSPDPPHTPDAEKLGYHYTGTHESYGRKTYKRIYPTQKNSKPSFFDSDKTIGMEMFRYGAGQYGTDEFSSIESKEPYPNEVIGGVDKPFSSSGEMYEPIKSKAKFNTHNSFEYNSDSPMTPYKPYSGEQDSSYNARGKNNYNADPQNKAPYTPQKAPYTPQTPSDGSGSAEYTPSYGSPSPNGPRPYSTDDDKRAPGGSPADLPFPGPPGPPSIDVTHSVSYSQDGGLVNGPITYAPEAPSLYLRPGPDPLTIPKNARVFEHHIRLHPMHYNLMALSRAAMHFPVSFSNAVYPVPLRKLIADPLKMPLVPVAPMHSPHMNPMLQRVMPARYW